MLNASQCVYRATWRRVAIIDTCVAVIRADIAVLKRAADAVATGRRAVISAVLRAVIRGLISGADPIAARRRTTLPGADGAPTIIGTREAGLASATDAITAPNTGGVTRTIGSACIAIGGAA